MLQFHFAQKIFGKLGEAPDKKDAGQLEHGEKIVPFTRQDWIWGGLSIAFFVGTIIFWNLYQTESPLDKFLYLLPFLFVFVTYVVLRLRKYPKVERDRITVISLFAFFVVFFWLAFEQAGGTMTIFANDYTERDLTTPVAVTWFRGISLLLTFIPMLLLTWVLVSLAKKIFEAFPLTIVFTGISFLIIWGIIIWINYNNFNNETLEVPASWFGTLNSFFIISLAPLFSMMWVRLAGTSINPSGPIKLAIGLFLLGIGFGALVVGASTIPAGAQTASVSMIWLVLAYFFHTVGELCLSPVGLSLVNKLSPMRLMALMFGIWYIANFVANFTGGMIGSYIDDISKATSMSSFFTIFVVMAFSAGAALVLLNKPIKRMMHGVE